MRPPLESRPQPVSSVGISLGGRSDEMDDLLVDLMEGIEGVEELLLRPVLAGKELDVVDEEHVDVRYLFRNSPMRAVAMELMTSLVNCSDVR